MSCWVNVISRDHVMLGVQGGFTQAGHGRPDGLRRLSDGDWVVFYSPKTKFVDGETLQAFTAIGQVQGDELYQVHLESGRQPWRKNMKFFDCQETPIKPMIEELSFIQDKTHWGYMFRFGLFKIPKEDFEHIKKAMVKAG